MTDAQITEQVIVKPFDGESKVHMSHDMDMQGMVMNDNRDRLPVGCEKISEDLEITIHAGRKYAQDIPGAMFGYDQKEWDVKPCSRIKVNFHNEDSIRHQFMIHGLPDYLYPPTGMFHIELNGKGIRTATFIVPNEKKTFLVHCELSQHMEKGMKAQLKVDGGDGDLPNIPGLTQSESVTRSPVQWRPQHWLALIAAGFLGIGVVFGAGILFRKTSGGRVH